MTRKFYFSIPLIIAGSLALGVAVLAQTKNREFKDAKGTFRVWNYTSFETTVEGGKRKVDASGNPVRAISNTQGLTLEAKTLEGQLKNQEGGGMAFDWVNLVGAVDVEQLSTSTAGKTSRKLTSERLRIDDGADQSKVTLPAKFTFTDLLTPASNLPRTVTINAASGELFLSPLKPNSEVTLRSGTLNSATVDILLRSEKDSSTSQVKSGKILLSNGQQAKLTFPGSFEFENERVKPGPHGNATSKARMTGSSGVMNLVALENLEKLEKNENPLLSAVIEGPVNLVMDSVNFREVDENGVKKVVKEFSNVKAKGTKLTFNKAENKILLEGDVESSYETWREGDTDRNPFISTNDWIEIILTADGLAAKTVRAGQGSVTRGGGR